MADIEQQKQTEDALRKNEEKYRLLFETTRDVIIFLDRNGNVVDINPRGEQLIGYPRSDLIRMNAFENLIVSEDHPVVRNLIHEASEGRTSTYEVHYRTKEGKIIHFESVTVPRMSAKGEFLSTFCTLHDLTERKLAKEEETLRKNEEKLRTIFSILPVGISIINSSRRIMEMNPALERIVHMTHEGLLTGQYKERKYIDISGAPIPADQLASSQAIIQQKPILNTEMGIVLEDSSIIWTGVSAAPLPDGGAVVVTSDINERKRVENALRESEKKFRTLFESANDALIILDMQGNIVDFNRIAHERLGYTREEMRHMNIAQLNQPAFNPMISERIKHLKEHGQLVVELAHMRKDGSSMQVEMSARLVTLRESDVIFSVVRDITERKRAEDELRRSERVLREAEELGHTGSWEHNLITGEIFNSKENARMFFGDDSSKGARFDDYGDAVHPDDRAFVMERHAQLLAEGGPRDIEFRVVWPDGGVHVLFGRATVVRDESGQAIRVYGTNLDITERKRAEKALLQSQEKYRLIVDAANEGIWVIDEYDKTSFVNAQMADMLGYEAEEMIGRKLESFMFGEDLPDYAQKKEKRRQGIAEHFERQWRRKDGQVVQTIVSATPIIDNEHHFLGSFAMILDITERKKLEAQLRQAQKMESIGTLAGGVAHDFNNILTAIIGYGHIALLKMSKDDPNRTNIEQILEASNRATHLTKDLLLFSRKQPLDRKPIDLNEDILKLGKFLVRVIGEDIAFKTSLSGGTIPVFADEHQIGQVLMNLATNSRDSMPKGGTFTISTELVHLDEEFTSKNGLEMPGKYVLISVSDTGHGMDEETKQRIFEPFYTTKEVGKGTGLGLAVVYGIVKQHAGCINVYSEPGIGTTFKIYLPVIVSGAAEEKATASEELPVGGTETILLAEDNESVRNLIVSVLKESGYTVITAVDGEDAVSKYQENEDKIQLLLFDLIMPKKNGKEAYDEISQIRPDIKAIFASGYSPDIIRDKGALGSSTTVVYKPISPIDLLKKVRSVLDEGKLNMNL